MSDLSGLPMGRWSDFDRSFPKAAASRAFTIDGR